MSGLGSQHKKLPVTSEAAATLPPFIGYYARRSRVLGLDLLRISASLTIVLYHGYWIGTLPIIGANPITARIETFGYLGVDLFFVLSAWLLVGQALRLKLSLTNGSFFTFWSRRWLRTIPSYWVALVLALVPFFGFQPGMLVRSALFLQTLPTAYAISWSLVAEEWFYLSLPLVIVLCWRIRNWRTLVLLGSVSLLIPIVIRASLIRSSPWHEVQMVPHARFEGLVVGAALAAIALHRPEMFALFVRRRRLLFVAGLTGMVALLAISRQESWWFETLGMLTFSLLIGALIPLLSNLRWPVGAPIGLVIGVTLLSDLTYPLYLIHTIVPTMPGLNRYSTFLYGLSWLLGVLVAAIALHLLVERPFLSIRARIAARGAQTNIAAAGKAAA